MECIQCGATLRPGARFCNQCGAAQPLSAPDSTASEQSPAAGEQPPGLVKRPPRPVRAEDEDEDEDERDGEREVQPTVLGESQATIGGDKRMAGNATIPGQVLNGQHVAAPSEIPTPPAAAAERVPSMPPLADLATAPAAESAPPSSEAGSALDQPAGATTAEIPAAAPAEPPVPMPSQPSAPDEAPEEAEAAEAATSASTAAPELRAAPTESGESASPTETESAEPVASAPQATALEPGAPADAREQVAATTAPALESVALAPEVASEPAAERAWPLPAGFLVAGRYRVESVLTAAPEGDNSPAAANIYLATDTHGYEHCWSCGAEHGEAAAGERFCPLCGADMLARALTLTERRPAAPEALADAPPPAADEVRFLEADREYRVAPRASEAPAFPAGPVVVVGAASDIGLSRQARAAQNEDSFGVMLLALGSDDRHRTLGLFAVADGLGGHASGQEASRTTVRVLAGAVLRALGLPLLGASTSSPEEIGATNPEAPTPEVLRQALLDGARAANEALLAANAAAEADSGSTLVAALVWDDTAYVVNAGDSRTYVFADGALNRLTIDHSLIEGLIAGGLVNPEDRYSHPQRNQIIRSLGDDPELHFDLFEQRLAPGMRLLLCSDGLWEMVRDPDLARILAETPHPQAAADALVHAANENGGEDNITAVVVEVRA